MAKSPRLILTLLCALMAWSVASAPALRVSMAAQQAVQAEAATMHHGSKHHGEEPAPCHPATTKQACGTPCCAPSAQPVLLSGIGPDDITKARPAVAHDRLSGRMSDPLTPPPEA